MRKDDDMVWSHNRLNILTLSGKCTRVKEKGRVKCARYAKRIMIGEKTRSWPLSFRWPPSPSPCPGQLIGSQTWEHKATSTFLCYLASERISQPFSPQEGHIGDTAQRVTHALSHTSALYIKLIHKCHFTSRRNNSQYLLQSKREDLLIEVGNQELFRKF